MSGGRSPTLSWETGALGLAPPPRRAHCPELVALEQPAPDWLPCLSWPHALTPSRHAALGVPSSGSALGTP